MKTTLRMTAFFLSILYTQCLLAEGDVSTFAPGTAQGGAATRVTDIANAPPVSYTPNDFSIAQGESGGLLGDVSKIKRNTDVAPTDFTSSQLNRDGGKADREEKAENARDTGKLGTGIHMASSMALAARARTLDLPAPAIAAALHAMAALELSQSIVDAATSGQNEDQRAMLEKAEGSGSSYSGNESRTANRFNNGTSEQGKSVQINSPELDSYLQKQGVNVDDFKGKLATGEFKSVDDVLNAMGMSGKVSEYDLKQAERIADKTIRDSVNHNEQNSGRYTSLTGNESVLNSSSLSSVGGAGSVRDAGAGFSNENTTIQTMSKEERLKSGQGEANGSNASIGGTMTDYLKKFTADNSSGLLGRKLTDYEIQLEKANVYPSTGRMQIFQIAHRNYREYGKWRRSTKLAVR